MKKTSGQQGELLQLSKEYADRLLETISDINSTWQKLCNISWEDDSFSSLQVAVHKLAGTAKSYGFDEVGQRALMLDHIFRKIEDIGLPTEAEKQQIEARLEELTALAHKPSDSETAIKLSRPSISTSDLVYIVDDDDDASRYFEVILNAAGYTTEIFSNLADFHRALEQKRPDLIIMDIIFPEGQFAGIDAINQLGTELGKNIPIIFVSVRSDVQARIRALRAGGCAYITKPVEPETILSVVASNSSVEQEHSHILVVDDDPIALSYFETLMKGHHYDVLSTADPRETLQAIESFKPNVVVMDYNMPGYNGEELVKMLRQDERYVNLPVIMVTGDRDPEVEERVSQLSNTRFLTKPVDDEIFINTITSSIQAACRSQKLMLDVLKQHPHGLLNLYYFYSELESIIATTGNTDRPYTLLYFAIDDPASIRKHMGLKKLVSLNKKISSYLLSHIGKNELISQLTEFVYLVLIQAEQQSNLKENIDLLKNRISNEVFTVDGISITVTPSIGAISISQKINSVDDAVSIAENASVEASQKGGNQVCIELASPSNSAELDSDIGHAFMEAFKGDSLRLQYQPIININTSESVYEAYARFITGKKMITPEQFLPYMEEYNLEFEFNQKLVTAGLNDIARGQKKPVVIIKLEPVHGTSAKYLDWFSQYVDSKKLNINNNLIFSFREDWVLKNHDNFKRFMKTIEQYDCGLALEHAGTSKYTADLVGAIDPLYTKLSPELVKQLLSNYPGDSRETLKKLLATDTRVVASSVENADTFAKLMALGIDYFQGYIVQQPGTDLDFSISKYYV